MDAKGRARPETAGLGDLVHRSVGGLEHLLGGEDPLAERPPQGRGPRGPLRRCTKVRSDSITSVRHRMEGSMSVSDRHEGSRGNVDRYTADRGELLFEGSCYACTTPRPAVDHLLGRQRRVRAEPARGGRVRRGACELFGEDRHECRDVLVPAAGPGPVSPVPRRPHPAAEAVAEQVRANTPARQHLGRSGCLARPTASGG